MKADCVILNYNDAETVEKLVKHIYGYDCFGHIILVDNASADDSYSRLMALQDEKITVIRAEKNGGYGAGNNLGVRYAAEQYDASHVLVCNPDVIFSEACVYRMMKLFKNHPEAGVVTAKIDDAAYPDMKNGWPLRSFGKELLAMGPVSRRLFDSVLNYPDARFQERKAAYVDAVHGSMLMVSTKAFQACKGYDEGIFLYQEETVLASRMKASGYRTILALDETYLHQHSATITKSIAGAIARQRLREQSVMYYLIHYLHISRVQKIAAKVWFWIIRMEIRLWGMIKKD